MGDLWLDIIGGLWLDIMGGLWLDIMGGLWLDPIIEGRLLDMKPWLGKLS